MSGTAAQCYNCATSFGGFWNTKQLCCVKCKYVFCKKCLTKTATGATKGCICDKCRDILSGKKLPPAKYIPPDALAKRLAAQQAVQGSNKPNLTASGGVLDKYQGMSKEDIELAQRLERLKERPKADVDTRSIPNQADIEARLANLKVSSTVAAPSDRELADRLAVVRGQNPNNVNQPSMMPTRERRSEQEQIDSLLNEASDEVAINARREADYIRDLEIRLNRLKGIGATDDATAAATGETLNDLNKCSTTTSARRSAAGRLNVPPPGTSLANHPTAAVDRNGKEEELSEVDRLMRQAAAETRVDAHRAIGELKKDKELWKTVEAAKKARGSRHQEERDDSDASEDDDDDEDEDKATRRIIKQLMEEDRLDEASAGLAKTKQPVTKTNASKTKTVKKVESSSEEDSDELPWCCMCDNDATLGCTGCDDDLYCQRCFRETHDRVEMAEGHAPVKYCTTKSKP